MPLECRRSATAHSAGMPERCIALRGKSPAGRATGAGGARACYRLVNSPALMMATRRIAHSTMANPIEAAPERLQSGLCTIPPCRFSLADDQVSTGSAGAAIDFPDRLTLRLPGSLAASRGDCAANGLPLATRCGVRPGQPRHALEPQARGCRADRAHQR